MTLTLIYFTSEKMTNQRNKNCILTKKNGTTILEIMEVEQAELEVIAGQLLVNTQRVANHY